MTTDERTTNTSENPWDAGDYPILARRMEPAAWQIVAAVGPGQVGRRRAERGWRGYHQGTSRRAPRPVHGPRR